MKTHRRSERGQVLIFVVFGMVALIGMTALAVDGGNAYSDRRHAQNAADTAALAAGLSLIRHTNIDTGQLQDPTDWTNYVYPAGMNQALANGYDNNLTTNVVHVWRCSDTVNATCVLPNPLPPLPDGMADSLDNYIQVTITSHVNTYFARVLGITQVTNDVQAIAKAVPPHPVPWYNGSALVATMPGCKSGGWPHDPFTVTGGSLTVVTGSGNVFVNSDCPGALTGNGGSTLSSVSGICSVGGYNPNGGQVTFNPVPSDYCNQVDAQAYQQPAVNEKDNCTDAPAGTIVTISPGNYLASPGRYDNVFPPNGYSPGAIRLAKGIYCFENGISFQGTSAWNLTTDINGDGVFDGSDGTDEGALLYVPHGGVTFNGQSQVHIGAINKPGTPAGIKGYLFYVPPDNPTTVKLAGGNGSVFIGTVLAPSSYITINGGSGGDSLNLQCQIIGYSINLEGSGTLNISFSQSQNGQTYTNPILQPYK